MALFGRKLCALALTLAAPGCTQVGTLQTAHTAGRGRTEVGLELGEQATVTQDKLRAFPVAGVSVRHGVTERIDLGGRLGPSAIELLAKFQLTPPPPALVVSIAPQIAAYAWTPEDVEIRSYNAVLPVLVGIPLPHEHQLVLGPRVQAHSFALGAGSARAFVNTLVVGTTVGVAWKLPGPRAVRIVTELGAVRPALTWAERSDGVGGVSFRNETWTVQANLAFLLGAR